MGWGVRVHVWMEDFYAAIGYGGISVIRMMPSIKEAYYKLVKANQPPEVIITPPKKRVKDVYKRQGFTDVTPTK